MTFKASIIVSITIIKKIGMLHIKQKLKTAVLHRKYNKVSLRLKDGPQADLHWILMTSKLSVLNISWCVSKETWAPQDIICVKTNDLTDLQPLRSVSIIIAMKICNMPNYEAIVILTILEVWASLKVIRGWFMLMRGHMIQNSRIVLPYASVVRFLLIYIIMF